MKCPVCNADNTEIPDEEILKRYTPYPILCWYCTSTFTVFHHSKKIFVKELLIKGNPQDRLKFSEI